MKWEKLKELIQDDILENPNSPGALEVKREAAAQGTNVAGYLRTYDIRAVSALRSRFPDVFPVYLQTCMLYLNNDHRGQWTIDAKPKL